MKACRAKGECFQVIAGCAKALLAGAVGFSLIGVKGSGQVQADKRVTTETTAAAAGDADGAQTASPAEVKQRHSLRVIL